MGSAFYVMDDNKLKTENLKKLQAENQQRAFRMMFEILIIFGLPALVATVAGKLIDNQLETGRLVTLSLLAIAFVSSWFMVILKYRKLSREMKKLDQELKEMREQELK